MYKNKHTYTYTVAIITVILTFSQHNELCTNYIMIIDVAIGVMS